MQPLRKLDLTSMYMTHAVLQAHTIALQLEDFDPEAEHPRMKGTITLDPNTCSLDLWGDRRGCTRIARRTGKVEATRVRTPDPRHHRIHWMLEISELPDSRVSLIEYRDAGLWYLSVPTETESVTPVALFDVKRFA